MAMMRCSECGKEIESTASCCPECGCPITVYSKQDKESSFKVELRSIRKVLIVLAVICFVTSAVFFYKAHNVKNVYYNSEDYSILNENAYVGGDAYNYIINGTYFTGYSVIASSALLSGMLLISSFVNITIKIKGCE